MSIKNGLLAALNVENASHELLRAPTHALGRLAADATRTHQNALAALRAEQVGAHKGHDARRLETLFQGKAFFGKVNGEKWNLKLRTESWIFFIFSAAQRHSAAQNYFK